MGQGFFFLLQVLWHLKAGNWSSCHSFCKCLFVRIISWWSMYLV